MNENILRSVKLTYLLLFRGYLKRIQIELISDVGMMLKSIKDFRAF